MSNKPTRLSASDLHDLSLDPKMDKEKIYDKWAETYEGYVNKLNYLAPKNVAKEVFDFLEGMKIDHLKILDFGCGTGLLGQELKKVLEGRYTFDIGGVDISEKMIEKCREKMVYNSLVKKDLFKEELSDKKSYDLIVSSGVFLEGHVSFKMVDVLLDYLKSQKFIVFTIRDSFKKEKVEEYNKYVVSNPRLEILYNLNIDYLPYIDCTLIIGKKIYD
tara:strand:- start:231 stop:881 length:651 start_codon:yes stop_codon:yes gene_type:complete